MASTAIETEIIRTLQEPTRFLDEQLRRDFKQRIRARPSSETEITIYADVRAGGARDIVQVTKWRTADLYGYADTPVIDFLNAVGEIGFQIRELGKIEQQDIEFEVATVKLWQCIRSLSKFATISPRHTEIMSALYTLTIGDNSLLNNAKLKGLDAVSELIQDNIGLP